ncbi:MAG: hypothetical protein ACOC6J_10720, partial [Spirochaetota bacterium]
MKRYAALTILLLLASALLAETLRGPLGEELSVTPVDPAEATGVGLEDIVLIDLDGDARFLDAIDVELTSPPVV